MLKKFSVHDYFKEDQTCKKWQHTVKAGGYEVDPNAELFSRENIQFIYHDTHIFVLMFENHGPDYGNQESCLNGLPLSADKNTHWNANDTK